MRDSVCADRQQSQYEPQEEEESGDEAMDVSMTAPAAPDAMNGGAKRKLVEEDDYD